MLIGIDFDNTVAGYDHLFSSLAKELGVLTRCPTSKREVRDALRAKGEDGERQWRRLQALAYGERMAKAELIDGVEEFLRRCRTQGVPVCIVSHKTRRSPVDESGTDLCAAALNWMEEKGILAANGLGLSREHVFFEPTRQAKVARISALGCSHFIDDLPEVFREPGFPAAIEAILFDPAGTATVPKPDGASGGEGWARFADWHGIRDHVFAYDGTA